VRWNPDPPYSMRNAAGSVVGLHVELVALTLERIGCRPIWVELPWARALVELQAGRLDILPGALRRPERESYAFWVEQHVTVPNRLYVAAARQPGLSSVRRLRDLPAMRLGVQLGVVYGPEYAERLGDAAFRASLTQTSSRQSLWQMLDRGRVDGVLASEASARWELAELGLADRILPTGVVLSSEAAQVMFSRRSVDVALVQRYREAAEQLEANGTLARIAVRYLGR